MEIKDISIRMVAICDDEEKSRKQCHKMCSAYFKNQGLLSEIMEFSSAEELMENRKELHFIFLDIEMPGLSGIEAKGMLARTQPGAAIIFMTNYPEYMPEAFGKNVCNFLKKPLDKEKVHKTMDRVSLEMEMRNDFVVVNSRKIILSQVLYIKGEDKYVRFVIYHQEPVIVRGTMTEWEGKLGDKGFFRAHRSYIVNLRWVYRIERDVVLKNREYVPVARGIKSRMQEAHFEFLSSAAY